MERSWNRGNMFWLASIGAGLLLSLAWWEKSTPLLMLVAFIPILYIFDLPATSDRANRKSFITFLPPFLIYNLLTISWLGKASVIGSALVILESSFLMTFVFWLASITRSKSNNITGYVALITLWLTYEHIAFNVKVITPWLNIGNALGSCPPIIQWYEFTGVSGGTLWVLIVNLVLYKLIRHLIEGKKKLVIHLIAAFVITLLPLTISVVIYFNYTEKGIQSEIQIVQPNIDPYSEKFSSISFKTQLINMLDLADQTIDKCTEWILLPETAVDNPFYESGAATNTYVIAIDSFLSNHKTANLMGGVTTLRSIRSNKLVNSSSKRRIGDSNIYYEVFNSAMHVGHGEDIRFYHKSKLIPGIEENIRWFPSILINRLIPNLGGTMQGYGTQKERDVFHHGETGSVVAPVICYESAYGEFVAEYITKGAELIFIITNDGWWENTAGYKQHLIFASIRAIETRRSVARAANTGISCFVNQRGKIISRTNWWTEDVITGSLQRNNTITFYVKYGDLIYNYADILSIFLLIIVFVAIPLRKLRPD